MGLTLLIAFASSSGQPKGGTVRGTVIDLETKDPVYNADVLLLTPDGKYAHHGLFGTRTDRNGHFQIRTIQPGIYKLKTVSIGYKADTLGPFAVADDTLLDVVIRIDPYFGSGAEDARRDLDSGRVQLYLAAWPMYSKEQAELARHYGFEIANTGCTPMWNRLKQEDASKR